MYNVANIIEKIRASLHWKKVTSRPLTVMVYWNWKPTTKPSGRLVGIYQWGFWNKPVFRWIISIKIKMRMRSQPAPYATTTVLETTTMMMRSLAFFLIHSLRVRNVFAAFMWRERLSLYTRGSEYKKQERLPGFWLAESTFMPRWKQWRNQKSFILINLKISTFLDL